MRFKKGLGGMRNGNWLLGIAIASAIQFNLNAQEVPPAAEKPATQEATAPSASSPVAPATTATPATQPAGTQAAPGGRTATRGPRRPSQSSIAFSRGSTEVRKAYTDVSSKALDATLRIYNGKDRAALGTVIAPEGLVLTKASEVHADVECELVDGTKAPAKVVGIVQEHDLALLQIDISKAPGQIAYVSLFEGDTPAVGTLLASPNPDLEPAAVGVLSAAPRLVPKLPGRMGIQLGDDDDGPARIASVVPNGPALRAKMAPGDVITSVQGVAVQSKRELQAKLKSYEPGDTVKITVLRGDAAMEFTVTLGGDAMFPEMQGRSNREEFQNRLGGDLSRRRVGFKSVIQHDTVLIPTDCGGPLVDLDGNVIGINIARAGRVASYAVPSSVIRAILPDMIAGKFAPRSDVDQQLQKLAQVEDELLKKIGALRNILSGEPDEDEEEGEKAKAIEAILPDDEKTKIEAQIGELESQLAKVRADLLQLETKKAGGTPSPTSTNM
jgi:serine protease Do